MAEQYVLLTDRTYCSIIKLKVVYWGVLYVKDNELKMCVYTKPYTKLNIVTSRSSTALFTVINKTVVRKYKAI